MGVPVKIGHYAALAACLFLTLGCSPDALFKRMENEINDLKVEVFRQRQEIEKLTKKAEDDQKTAASERERDNRFRADTRESLRKIEENTQAMGNRLSYGSGQRPSAPAPRPQTAPWPAEDTQPQPTQPTTPEPDDQQLVLAERDFNSGNYEGAAEAADNLIKYFPDSENVPEALYLKGRALFAMRSYGKAQETFQKLCNEYPRSERFRASRLHVGRCQLAQGNTLAAIATFEDISSRWPSSPEARSAGEMLQDIKSNR